MLGPDEPSIRYAGFWKRTGAAIIDVLAIGVPVNVIVAIGGGSGFSSSTGVHQRTGQTVTHFHFDPPRVILFTAVSMLANWIYFATMESSRRQATLGKMAIGIVVTDDQGGRISFARATGRHFAKLLSTLILDIGFMMAGWTRRKQALHDMVANTLVIVKPTS